MTIKEVKAVLDEAGIEYDAKAKLPELKALMPKRDSHVDSKDEEEEEEVIEEKEEEEVSKKDTVVVHYKGRTREYSKEIHGKDYKKLAEQFAEKFDGEVK